MHINIKNIINDNKNNIVFQGYYKYSYLIFDI